MYINFVTIHASTECFINFTDFTYITILLPVAKSFGINLTEILVAR